MKKITLSILLVLLVCSVVHAQSNMYKTYMREGDAYLDDGEFSSALEKYRQACIYSLKNYGGDSSEFGLALLKSTMCFEGLDDYDKAYNSAMWAHGIFKHKKKMNSINGVTFCMLGRIQDKRGYMDSSINFYRKGIKLLESEEYIKTKGNIRQDYIYALLNLASLLEEADEGTPIEIEYLRTKAKRFLEGWNN